MRLPPLPPTGPELASRTWPAWWLSDGDDSDPEHELQNWSSLIGIVTAICGNVLIALALNVQRYAHIRLHRRKLQIRERARQAMKNAAAASRGQGQGNGGAGRYGAAGTGAGAHNGDSNGVSLAGTETRNGNGNGNTPYRDDPDAVDTRRSSETDPLAQSFRSDGSANHGEEEATKTASTYLKDPYWWLGQVLITVGEMGNFLAYGFAPASIVSPLGVVALVSNCVIAPIFFKEVFRQRDFWGVVIAIFGAVTVVLSAKTEETKLGPHEVWDAITTMEFEIYLGVTCGLIALLMWLSPRYGSKTILIDLGLVGLFGGYTALSTKGVSSMLSSTLLGAFTTPVTYVLVFVLLFTAIMQVRYVNKALQRFESTQVIPVQFVLFTLCVIIGSAVLYRDFERTTSEQAIKFIGGCLFTFFGVFIITSGRPRQDHEDEVTLSDAEGIEETIGLAEHDRATPPTPPRPRSQTPARSRGSSSTSRVSFSDTNHRSLAALSSQGFLPSRAPPGRGPPQPIFLDNDSDEDDGHEDAPLLSNPWQNATPPSREPVPSTTPSTRTLSETDGADTHPHPAANKIPPTTPPRIALSSAAAAERTERQERPTTPRAPASTSRLPTLASHVYSPSPFSSTLSAVVGDKLMAHIDGREGYGYSRSYGGGGGSGSPAQQGAVGSTGQGQVGRGGFGAALGFGSGSGFGTGSTARRRGLGGLLSVGVDGAADGDESGVRERGSVSAGELVGESEGRDDGDSGNGGGNGGGNGFRGRARSLSQTLGLAGLFSGTAARRAALVRRDTDGGSPGGVGGNAVLGGEGEVFGGPLERARTAGAG